MSFSTGVTEAGVEWVSSTETKSHEVSLLRTHPTLASRIGLSYAQRPLAFQEMPLRLPSHGAELCWPK